MRPFVSSKAMTEIDKATMSSRRLSSFQLMEEVSEALCQELALEKGPFLFLCGPGNNGGDGWRTAEFLRRLKRDVFVVEVLDAKTSDCRRAKRKYGGNSLVLKSPQGLQEVVRRFTPKTVVDAIFGNGARASLPVRVREALRVANALEIRRIAIDSPTGVSVDSVDADSLKADLTLTIAHPKEIFMAEEAAAFIGDCRVVAQQLFRGSPESRFWMLERSDFLELPLSRAAHKGDFGKCGVVGGSSKTPTAPLMAAEAAARVGAGYVTLFFADRKCPRLTLKNLGFLYPRRWTLSELQNQTALVMGCGGFSREARAFLRSKKCSAIPLVLDAEALNFSRERSKNLFTLMTPHWGEAMRLLKAFRLIKGPMPAKNLQSRRETLDLLVTATGHSVYLKGAPGLLRFSGDPKVYVNLSANPVFAKAGSGDILAGIMGGFCAQFFARPSAGELKKSQEAGRPLFQAAIINALLFQREVGEILRGRRATLVTDQLSVFEEAFRGLGSAP